jgi:2-C-methyl-D-erythritol 4-phosphate cytidylyltransferase
MKYSVIIPAAGSGSRMGADVPKVLLRIPDSSSSPSILSRTLNVFINDPLCSRIVVCVPSTLESEFSQEVGGGTKVLLAHGGATRQESVRRGVEALAERVRAEGGDEAGECVLVHDAARCFVTVDVIRRVVEGVAHFGAVTAAVPVPDSLCKVSDGTIAAVVDRENVWAVQTPQGFLLGELRGAHFAALTDGFVALDDASVVARLRDVRVVEGDRFNIKVTHPADLGLATRISQLG